MVKKPFTSTKPMDCLNDASCFVTQSRAVIDAIIDANINGEQPVSVEALYGVITLLDLATNRMCEAQEVANG